MVNNFSKRIMSLSKEQCHQENCLNMVISISKGMFMLKTGAFGVCVTKMGSLTYSKQSNIQCNKFVKAGNIEMFKSEQPNRHPEQGISEFEQGIGE